MKNNLGKSARRLDTLQPDAKMSVPGVGHNEKTQEGFAMTAKTTRTMEATIKAFATGEFRIMAVKARNLYEALGKAIILYGTDAVAKVYDPFTGDVWENRNVK